MSGMFSAKLPEPQAAGETSFPAFLGGDGMGVDNFGSIQRNSKNLNFVAAYPPPIL
jgi:hypothetical protein